MNIKSFLSCHLTAVAEIEKACFPNDYWTYDMILSSFNQDNFVGVVCEENDVVVGYAMANYCIDEADVLNVAVLDNYRRKGIGNALISNLLNELKLKGVSKVFLEVRSKNVNAINLYFKNGFTKISVRNNYYGDDDALILTKEL